MNTQKILITLLLFIAYPALSQYGWLIRGTGVSEDALVKGISFSDVNNGMIVTSNFSGYKVYRTSNGGANWTGLNLPTSNGMWAVKCFNPATAIICGAGGSIYRTTNSGTNWTQIIAQDASFLTAINFQNMNTGWISGGQLRIYKTTNNGVNWVNQHSFSTYTFSAIHFADVNTGVAADYFQNIVRTTNGGTNWINLTGPAGYDELWGVCMTDGNIFYSCGENSKIIKTTNAGLNWTVYNAGLQRNLYAIHFVNSNTGYCVGDSSLILRTSNAGNNWTVLSAPPLARSQSSALTCISFINENTGYIAGNDGTVLFTTTGGLTPVQNISYEIPSEFELKQNYPNPFNPSTNIHFSIPQKAKIELTLCDVSGKMIETLINGELPAGTYNYIWNAESYSSGIYFCTIKAGKYYETKKMTLIK